MQQPNNDQQENTANTKDAHFWQEHVKQYQRSELSKAAYARKHQLIQHQFIYWCKKLNDRPVQSQQPTENFIRVRLKV